MKTSKTGLIEKSTFIQSSNTLIVAFAELGARRLIDIMLRQDLQEVMDLPKNVKDLLKANGAAGITRTTTGSLEVLTSHLDESYITLSFSWLETYLSIVEEALYLHDPRSLGDNIQIKLGKILETDSVAELVHDAVKKRLKEKSAWGLKNRILELKEVYGLDIPQSNEELDEISRIRNDLVHNKRIGDFKVTDGKITYAHREKSKETLNADLYLHKVFNLAADLLCEASKALNIDRRNKRYRDLEGVANKFRLAFRKAVPSV